MWPSPSENYANSISFEARYAITNWIVAGIGKGHVIGPFTAKNNPFTNYVISPLFTVPKAVDDIVKRHRIIHHLSASGTNGISVNDVVPDTWKHVQYTTFKEVVKLAYELGPGAYIWTVDAQDAYYRVPIKKKFWPFMGFKWLGFFFFFTSLQMGLASSCNIYTRFADAVEYIIVKNNFNLYHILVENVYLRTLRHYLDDFFGGHKDKNKAWDQFTTVQGWFVRLGIPTRASKCVPPSQLCKILGWLYDTVDQMVKVPLDKVEKYCNLIDAIVVRGSSDKKELERVVGKLQWASYAIFPGKAFIRRLEKLMYLPGLKYGQKVRLSRFVIEDLKWWSWALRKLNGVPFEWLLKSHNSNFDVVIWTDASSKIGMGGWSSLGRSFQLRWSQTILKKVKKLRSGLKIQFMELLGLIIAAKIWAPQLKYKTVEFRIDNRGAEHAVKYKAAALWREDMNFLIRELATLAVEYKFKFWVTHIIGDKNTTADALSRFYDPVKFDLDRLQPEKDFELARTATHQLLTKLESVPLNGFKELSSDTFIDYKGYDPWHSQI